MLRQFKIPGPVPSFYQAIIGGDACVKKPKACSLDQGHHRQRRRPDGDVPAVETRPRLPAEARRAVLLRRAEGMRQTRTPARRRLPGDGAVHDLPLRPEPGDRLRPQPAFQGVVARRAARRIPRQDRHEDRLDDRGRDHRRCRTARPTGCYDAPPADRLQEVATSRPSRSSSTRRRRLPHGAEHQGGSVQQPEGAPGAQLRHRPQGDPAIWGGPKLAAITCQVLPPNFPGYEPYCPYTQHPGHGVVRA